MLSIRTPLTAPLYTQQSWNKKGFELNFWKTACFATSILNVVSTVYQKETGSYLSPEQAELALKAAIYDKSINEIDAYVSDIAEAANYYGEIFGIKREVFCK